MVNRRQGNAGWVFKPASKRVFPKKYSATAVRTSRIDANLAAIYNSQRSKATFGSGRETNHKQNNNFTITGQQFLFICKTKTARIISKVYIGREAALGTYNEGGVKRINWMISEPLSRR